MKRRRHRARIAGACAATLVALGAGFTGSAPSGATALVAPTPAVRVRHGFQIVLENQEVGTSFPGTGTELDRLAASGVFVSGYYGTGHQSLDNYLAMVSGQAQYSSTSQDCPIYLDGSGTVDAHGFYEPLMPQDSGCVYPAAVKTLPDQLIAKHKSWKGYMEDLGNTATRETAPCGQPAFAGVAIDPSLGGLDDTQAATAADQYAARHNPFVYFHSLLDSRGVRGDGTPKKSPCAKHVVGLRALERDLATNHVANWNFITPNLCDDGHDSPCRGPGAEGTNPGAGGLTSANAFLAKVVPAIQASKAYRDGGLIVITFDEGTSDEACCGEGAFSTGGGRVGVVLLGPHVHPHVSTCTYNHFALLRTWEDAFGLGTLHGALRGSDGLGHLGHAGDAGLIPLTRELGAQTDPCAGQPG